MKTIITVLATFLALGVFGQDDTLQNKDDSQYTYNKTEPKQVIEYDEHDSNKVAVRSFYESGQLKQETNYNPYNLKRKHGKTIKWFENGQVKVLMNYDNGMLHGEVLTYWENGLPKREDLFDKNIFVEGKVWDSAGNEIEHFDFIVNPEFPGGDDGLIAYLNKNLYIPKKSKRKSEGGRVIVRFDVEMDGSVSNVWVLQGVNYELDADVMKAVKGFPNWEPGIIDGEIERIEVNMPFKL